MVHAEAELGEGYIGGFGGREDLMDHQTQTSELFEG